MIWVFCSFVWTITLAVITILSWKGQAKFDISGISKITSQSVP